MIHSRSILVLSVLAAFSLAAPPAFAKPAKPAKESAKEAKSAKSSGKGKSIELGTFENWKAYATQGKKTCYALTRPKDRSPKTLKRDDAYIFISDRPADNVRNEVSIIMGFAMKDGSEPKADINGVNFDLIAKGSNAWVKNASEEGSFIQALKKGSKLVVKASSAKGHATTDTYSLGGVTDALARIRKECP
ncbi:MAG: hypothetical protein KGL46_02185 [Hyphomicrobiales bacterium]|nr:hypothetical protein [Hyphomicrobiales bacterium]